MGSTVAFDVYDSIPSGSPISSMYGGDSVLDTYRNGTETNMNSNFTFASPIFSTTIDFEVEATEPFRLVSVFGDFAGAGGTVVSNLLIAGPDGFIYNDDPNILSGSGDLVFEQVFPAFTKVDLDPGESVLFSVTFSGIVGNGVSFGNTTGFSNTTNDGFAVQIAAVPEPSTYIAGAAGLGLIACVVYQRRRKAKATTAS